MFWVVAARMRVRSRGGGIFGAGFWFGLFVCWRGLLIFGRGLVVVVVMVLFSLLMREARGELKCVLGLKPWADLSGGGLGSVETAGDGCSNSPPCFEFFENRPSAVCHVPPR